MHDVRFGKFPRLRASLAEQMRRTPAPQARSLCKSQIVNELRVGIAFS